MFCPQCGAKNDQDSRHCSQCGTALGEPVLTPPQVPQPPPPGAQPYYPPPPNVPGGPMVAGTVPNYMTQAIMVTLFCCIPLGIVGIFKANEVNKRLAANDYAGALAASNSARQILWWGVGVGLVVTVGWVMANINTLTGH